MVSGQWVSGQRSEVRGQRSEVRGQRSEVRGQRSEVRGQRSEVRGQRSEVRGQRSEVRGQRSEVRGQRLVAGGWWLVIRGRPRIVGSAVRTETPSRAVRERVAATSIGCTPSRSWLAPSPLTTANTPQLSPPAFYQSPRPISATTFGRLAVEISTAVDCWWVLRMQGQTCFGAMRWYVSRKHFRPRGNWHSVYSVSKTESLQGQAVHADELTRLTPFCDGCKLVA